MAATLRFLSQSEPRGIEVPDATPLAVGTGKTTNARKPERNAVECVLIVIPTVGQRDPTSVE